MTAYLARREEIARFLTARLGNAEDAQDVAQELFLRLERVPDPRELADPAAYVFRMGLNLANDHRRSRRRAIARDAAWASARHGEMGGEPGAHPALAQRGHPAHT